MEVAAVDGHEPDVGGLPDADHERVPSGRELEARLLDRELGELRAVVGEEDGPADGWRPIWRLVAGRHSVRPFGGRHAR